MRKDEAGTPAGWYPDPTMVATVRYWNGAEWTDQVAPAAASAGVVTRSGGFPRPFSRSIVVNVEGRTERERELDRKWLPGILVVLLIIGAIQSFFEEEPDASPADSSDSTAVLVD